MHKKIIVQDYNPVWKTNFLLLRNRLQKAMGNSALAIEHVGSTSVPELAAKPVIDIDIIVADDDEKVKTVIQKLENFGYKNLGDLGIPGRYAIRRKSFTFDNPSPQKETGQPEDNIHHNLYLCRQGWPSVENHLQLRDYLLQNPTAVKEYGDLKKRLAKEFPHDMGAYLEGKTTFITNILRLTGFSEEEILKAKQQNKKN